MRILVTGGAGFIGSHLTDRLINTRHKVVVIDDFSHGFKRFLNPKAKIFKIKIESKKISAILNKEKLEAIYHLAAKINSMGVSPAQDAKTNILGTLNLLEAAKKSKVKHFIFASSAAVYGEAKHIPTGEKSPKTPILFYGHSKLAAENFINYYSSNFKTTILRYSNVYGPRQDSSFEGGVVAIFFKKMIQTETVSIFGTGKQTRDFIYIDDIVEANLRALKQKAAGTFNISDQKETSIISLFQKIKKITRCQKDKIFFPKRARDVQRSTLSNKKARLGLKWFPKINLNKGLKKTYQYFLL